MKRKIIKIGQWSWGLLVAWTVILITSYFWNTHQVQSLLLDQARTELRANFYKDQTFRAWATQHGGVYVPVTETQQPDPYMEFLPERDVITPSGRLLTLINPALMVRQFNQLAQEKYDIQGRISGVKPLNPINRADPWESQAYQQFLEGADEVTAITAMDGASYLRLIRPMYMQKPCLKCHAQQGYQDGELSGGVSVSIPLAPIERMSEERMFTLKGGHLFIWLLGLTGILLGKRQRAFQVAQREQAYKSLEESEAKTRSIISSSMDAIISADDNGNIAGWNEQASEIFGWSEGEALGKSLAELIIPKRFQRAHYEGITRAVAKGSSRVINRRVEVIGVRKSGEEFPIELSIISTQIAGAIGFSAFIRDISEYKQTQQKIERDYVSQQLISSVLETSLTPESFEHRLKQILQQILSVPWLRLQAKGAIFINNGDEILEMVAHHGMPEEVVNTCSNISFGHCLCGQVAESKAFLYKGCIDHDHHQHFTNMENHGHYCLPILSGETLLGVLNLYIDHEHPENNDEVSLLSSICNTIGGMIQRNDAEQSLRYNAYHDELTGLPNRMLFLDRLGQRMDRHERDPGSHFAVLFLDLDRFKVINDSLGHTVGDRLLVEVAKRLSDCIRPEDSLARLGGDEFTLLLENVSSETQVLHVSERIYTILRDPFEVNGLELFASCSIGVAFGHSRYQQPEDMLRDADTAMYQAKSNSNIHTVFFDKEMHTLALSRLTMETELLHAFENNELCVYYQPIVSSTSGQLEGVEALVRWPRADGSMISPAEFIPIAEETGLVNEIGAWVLREACRQVREWQRAHSHANSLYVSVNLSGKQLLQADLFNLIETILKGVDFKPQDLRLEITESVLMDNSETNSSLLKKFREHGYRFYIDDFGTGYSSLSYLHSFPFDALKIDRSFVNNLEAGDEHTKLVATIISIAHNFNMKVIAEGVETERQHNQLREMGCEYLQGFLFSRPLPADKLFELLAAQANK